MNYRILLILLLMTTAPMTLAAAEETAGRVIEVSDDRELAQALWRAGAGDTVVLADGVYTVELTPQRSGTTGAPLVIRAANTHRAILYATGTDAALRHDGHTHIEIQGLVFQGANNSPQAAQAMVKPGNQWKLTDCIIRDADGCGLGIEAVEQVQLTNCIIEGNGQIGAAVSDSRLISFDGCVLRYNNPGVATEAELIARRIDERIQHDGRWHVNAAWEAGGIKISSSTRVVMTDCVAHDNFGPGLWADYANTDITFDGCRVYENRNLAEGWEGVGILVEYHAAGPTLVERCEVRDNEGPGILIAESRDVTVEHNRLIRDELELRDMPRSESELSKIRICKTPLSPVKFALLWVTGTRKAERRKISRFTLTNG